MPTRNIIPKPLQFQPTTHLLFLFLFLFLIGRGKSNMGTSSENPKPDPITGFPTNNMQEQQQMYPPPPQPPVYPPPPSQSPCHLQQYPTPYPYAPPSPMPFQHPNPNPYPPDPYSQPYDYYHQHQSKPLIHESDRSASLGRVLLTLMLVLVSSILTITLIMWFLFGASVPEFEVTSIKVSNFTATNTSLSGTWAVGMLVNNVNMELDVQFQHGMSSILYKDSLLGIVALDPFDVRKTQRLGLNFNVPALRTPDESWVLPTLAEDRSDGAVVVSLRLAMDANFTAPDVVYRQESLRVLCEDLVVRFSSSSGEGTWSPGLGNPCFIRLRDAQD